MSEETKQPKEDPTTEALKKLVGDEGNAILITKKKNQGMNILKLGDSITNYGMADLLKKHMDLEFDLLMRPNKPAMQVQVKQDPKKNN